MNKLKVLGYSVFSLATVLGTAVMAHAAADADILEAGSTTVSTLKENIFGLITNNIGTIAVIASLVFGIPMLFRWVRKFAK